ncbi:MAG: methyltransferase [Archangium gephyra]|uniref:Methyltransferase n=1 Tax=Archangium gephyra TaxID=48 RepID=A0A2W5VK98_9BACT|nr:MAG: methyltransferase [Archangium gephyra]
MLKGSPMRRAISEALEDGGNLGGKERRYIAFATRELSRHLRLLNLYASAHGVPMSKLHLPEDQAIFRYALWRRYVCGAGADKVMTEIALPGPLRPRSIPDQLIKTELTREVPVEVRDPADKHSFPTWLSERIAAIAPEGELDAILEALNREPTLTFRVRPIGTREALLPELKARGLQVEACEELPDAIRVTDGSRAIFETRWMKEGRLQVMDLGSQLLAAFCRARPGQVAVDFCAGAGGKTIVLADTVTPTGRVYAWDSSEKRLKEAKSRVGELKLRHVTFPTAPRIDLADLVLIDAPCSGTGTLGREPDQKWKLSVKQIDELNVTQLGILRDVARQLKPGALIVYGTCSVLREENEGVVEKFLAAVPGFTLEESLRVWPHRLEGGGFFGARLRKG